MNSLTTALAPVRKTPDSVTFSKLEPVVVDLDGVVTGMASLYAGHADSVRQGMNNLRANVLPNTSY